MHDVYGEACFYRKYLWIGKAKVCQYEPELKRVHVVETYWLSNKENVLGAVVSEEGHADSSSGTWKDQSLLISLKTVQL